MADLLTSLARRAIAAPHVRPRAASRFEDGPLLEVTSAREAPGGSATEAAGAPRPGAAAAAREARDRDDVAPRDAAASRDDEAASSRRGEPAPGIVIERTVLREASPASAGAPARAHPPVPSRDDAPAAARSRPAIDEPAPASPVPVPVPVPREATPSREPSRLADPPRGDGPWHARIAQRTERLVERVETLAAPARAGGEARDERPATHASAATVEAGPSIEIHIGRIDVRPAPAPSPLAAPVARAASTGTPPRSLDAVLAHRRSGT